MNASRNSKINYSEYKINYSYYKLNNLKDGLNEQRNNLQTVINSIKTINDKLCTSLVGKTKTALNKKIEALTGIIDNVNITNQTSLGVDMDIADQMGVKG